MRLRLAAVRERLRNSLWFVPTLCVAAAIALAVGSLLADRQFAFGGMLGFTGSPDGASNVLSTIAGAIVTLTALVFSVTIVALQLASSQYSPRVLRSFLRDRRSQLVLGVFLATFAYTLLVLRSVRSEFDGADFYVPALSVHIAFVLTALSLGFFVLYIHHISQSIQASVIVARVAGETREAIERLYPDTGRDLDLPVREVAPLSGPTAQVRWEGTSGYLQAVDEAALLACAERLEGVIRVLPRPGDFVAKGAPAFELFAVHDEEVGASLQRTLSVGWERTARQDAAFGFRQLVDIAERALSPGVNDPTTAVQALDRIYELLLLLHDREIPSPQRLDDEGQLRLVLARPSWDDYVHLAFDEIRAYGGNSVQLTRRLHAVLDGLLAVAGGARRTPLAQQRALVERAIERELEEEADRDFARAGTTPIREAADQP